jgi:hypothetical protein
MKKEVVMICVVGLVLAVGLLSGCYELDLTTRGMIKSLSMYKDMNDGQDILVIGFYNCSSLEVSYNSVKKYNLQVGQNVIIYYKFATINEVKDVYINVVEG